METEFAKESLKIERTARQFMDAQDRGLEATIETICNMAQQDLSYEEFTQYYPLADELVAHLEDHMYALNYE